MDEALPESFLLKLERDRLKAQIQAAQREITRLQELLRYADDARMAEYRRACAAEQASKIPPAGAGA